MIEMKANERLLIWPLSGDFEEGISPRDAVYWFWWEGNLFFVDTDWYYELIKEIGRAHV